MRAFFKEIDSQIEIIKGVYAKNLKTTLSFIDFSQAFDPMNRGKMEQIQLAYSLSKETVTAIMIFYKNTKAMVGFSDGDTDFFNIITGVLKWDT